jgi:hypothetical protein
MATREARCQLYQALEAHKFGLEITRGLLSGPDLEILDRRIAAVQLLLEWLSRALEPHPASFPDTLKRPGPPPIAPVTIRRSNSPSRKPLAKSRTYRGGDAARQPGPVLLVGVF